MALIASISKAKVSISREAAVINVLDRSVFVSFNPALNLLKSRLGDVFYRLHFSIKKRLLNR